MAKVRDMATVTIADGNTVRKRRGRNYSGSRSYGLRTSQVDPRVMKEAMRMVRNDISRIEIINETTVVIDPKK